MVEHISAKSMSSYVVSQSSSNGSTQSQAMMRKSYMNDDDVSSAGVKVSSNSRQPMVRIEHEVNGQTQVVYVPKAQINKLLKVMKSAKKSSKKSKKTPKKSKKTPKKAKHSAA